MRNKIKVISVIIFISWAYLSNITFSEEKRGKLRLSIKLTGGWGYTLIGDINTHLESLNNIETFESATGEITKLKNWSPDWEAELRLNISRSFGISLATSGVINQKNESHLVTMGPGIWGGWTGTFIFKPEAKARMPVKLGMYYNFPIISRINVFSTAGIGYYSASISKYTKFHEIVSSPGESYWMSQYWKTDYKANLGFHGGIGMEYSLTKNIA
jgi:opacity protein-like surface antigen